MHWSVKLVLGLLWRTVNRIVTNWSVKQNEEEEEEEETKQQNKRETNEQWKEYLPRNSAIFSVMVKDFHFQGKTCFLKKQNHKRRCYQFTRLLCSPLKFDEYFSLRERLQGVRNPARRSRGSSAFSQPQNEQSWLSRTLAVCWERLPSIRRCDWRASGAAGVYSPAVNMEAADDTCGHPHWIYSVCSD